MYPIGHLNTHGCPAYKIVLLFVTQGTRTNNCIKLALGAAIYPNINVKTTSM